MSQPRFLVGVLVGCCSLSALACAGPSEDDESTDTQQDEVKKKVKPKGGNGAFDLLAPGFSTAGFAGAFGFDREMIKPGGRLEKVPGTYWLQADSAKFADGQLMNQQLQYTITAGAIVSHKLGGLRIRFAEPVTLGATRVELVPERGSEGYLAPGAPWHAAAKGASMLMLTGKVRVTSATNATTTDVTIAEGALEEMVLPTSRVVVSLDAYDRAYPSPECALPSVRAGAQGFTKTASVRNADGSTNGSFVVPQGTQAPVLLDAYGIQLTQATVAGQTHTFTLNRLEVDDVEVTQAGGGKQLVKGTVSIARKIGDGSFASISCSFATHSGIDLPDGTYRVTSRAQSASGTVTSTEDVTFP